jgi:hypothetical protein
MATKKSTEQMSLIDRINSIKREDLRGISFKFEKPGDVIVGEILGIRSGTKYGDDKLMLRVRSGADGKVYAVFPTTMAASELLARGAMMGDKVAIRYMGMEKSPTGSSYKLMAVLVERKGVLINPVFNPVNKSHKDGPPPPIDEDVSF